ncbi:MAG: adenosylmethionine--8-amino-7-oxononanoate transaminase [Flavobacteriales bacterium]|nr:adenosylmethionine--8-amino-7-oxononanoate transaminase [Flavobacteriales bacterium]
MRWEDLDKKYIWHPFTQMQTAENPLAITKGKGSLLFDKKGNTYIDAISSWWVNLHGHSHPYLAEKVNEQMLNLEHVVFAGCTHEPAAQLCSRLKKHLPKNQEKFFFSDNGSSAVEIAIKMVIQYWHNKGENRNRFLALNGAYHGDTFGAMSAGARGLFSTPFNNYLFEVTHLPFPTEKNVLDNLKTELEKGEIACFIFEPLVQGAAGMRMYSSEILDKMIALCHEYGVLCIADEVMTGFGRTGTTFAVNQLKNKPDLMCMSKGLTGGTLPMSITTCNQKIYNAFLSNDLTKAFLHGHSFTGNPVGCAVSLASLDLLEKQKCQDNIKRIIKSHQAFAEEIKNHPKIDNLRQTGTILAIELTDENSGYASDLRTRLYKHFLSEGILIRPLGNVIYILPPYCITECELSTVYSATKKALKL